MVALRIWRRPIGSRGPAAAAIAAAFLVAATPPRTSPCAALSSLVGRRAKSVMSLRLLVLPPPASSRC